jgi:hypothetical protein
MHCQIEIETYFASLPTAASVVSFDVVVLLSELTLDLSTPAASASVVVVVAPSASYHSNPG